MKRIIWTLAGVVSVAGCTVVKVDPGQEAVLIDRPRLFGEGGIRDETIKPGLAYTWLTTDAIVVDVSPQVLAVAFDDFSSSDNILLDFETTIQYRVTNAPQLLRKFGPDWFKNNIRSQYASIVRDQVKRFDMTSMMSDVATAQRIDDAVTDAIRKVVKDQGLDVEIMNITLGRAKPNPDVLQQMNLTAAQQQRVKTLVEATNAELQRAKEQKAMADADNAYRNAMNLSPEQYLARQIAEINAEACTKAAACYVVPSGSSVVAK